MPRTKDGWGLKLHERHVRTIRRFHFERGWDLKSLAYRYGVTPSNIRQIIKEIIWKGIEAHG